MMHNILNKSRPSRGVPNLVIAQRVLDKMVAAASRYLADETGEAMVGLLVPGANTNGISTLYVLDTIAPDETAVREWGTFQQGDARQDELIWWLQENWHLYREKKLDCDGKPLSAKWDVPLRYLGDWHKQPGYMIQPSQGDLMTALHWIADESNGMDFLLAPIVTLGHPATTEITAHGNYITIPHGTDTCMRVDFWYLDDKSRDFLPISPAVYPDDLLPGLPDYPWHLLDESRFHAESDLLKKDGLFTTLVLWDVTGKPPLHICFLVARMGADRVLLIDTPPDYPASPPSARVAPFEQINADDELYAIFAALWEHSEPVADPPDWKWAEGRHLIDYIYALEESLGIKAAPPPESQSSADGQDSTTAPLPATEKESDGEGDEVDTEESS
jgi:hypothetical protein